MLSLIGGMLQEMAAQIAEMNQRDRDYDSQKSVRVLREKLKKDAAEWEHLTDEVKRKVFHFAKKSNNLDLIPESYFEGL